MGFVFAALGILLLIFLVARGGVFTTARSLLSAAVWATLVLALWLGFNHRDAFDELTGHLLDSADNPEPSVGKGGEVSVKRSFRGEFVIPAKVDDRPVRFVFDTGASTVVLTADDARRIGLDTAGLDFSAKVFTANGATLAAPTTLARVSVGPIVVRNVRALVTRPGAMEESLLGMSFLEQLQSYGVEQGRLTLKAR